VSQLCPYKSVLGANNGLKNVGLENMAINSTHFQWPDLDDFCATVFATTPSRFEVSGTRLNTGDSFKWKQRLENKRHTNTHLAMTSHSPIGFSIPPLRQILGSIAVKTYRLQRHVEECQECSQPARGLRTGE